MIPIQSDRTNIWRLSAALDQQRACEHVVGIKSTGRSLDVAELDRDLQIERHSEQACARRMQADAECSDSGRHDGNVLFHCGFPRLLENEDSNDEFSFWPAANSNTLFTGVDLLTILDRSFDQGGVSASARIVQSRQFTPSGLFAVHQRLGCAV